VKRTRGSKLPAVDDLIVADELQLNDDKVDPENDDNQDQGDGESNPLFDGRVWTGSQALAQGLVDANGYLDDAIDTAGRLAGLPIDAPVVLLRRSNDRAMSEFDVTPNMPMNSLLPISVPGLDRSAMPTFLYLWQPEPKFVTAGG
jgi:protease-4